MRKDIYSRDVMTVVDLESHMMSSYIRIRAEQTGVGSHADKESARGPQWITDH
jgi:hypothetical protein